MEMLLGTCLNFQRTADSGVVNISESKNHGASDFKNLTRQVVFTSK